MSEEEKKAIDFTKYLVNDYKKQLELIGKENKNYGYSDEEIDVIRYRNEQFEILLNLIEKQQKENEQLRTEVNSKKKEIEELKEEYNTKLLSNAGIYQLGFKDGKKSVEDKIKAKINELEYDQLYEPNKIVEDRFKIEILKELLEEK